MAVRGMQGLNNLLAWKPLLFRDDEIADDSEDRDSTKYDTGLHKVGLSVLHSTDVNGTYEVERFCIGREDEGRDLHLYIIVSTSL